MGTFSGSVSSTGSDIKNIQQSSLKKSQGLISANDPFLNWETGNAGDPTKSPMYSSFLTGAKEAITNSYDNAVTGARANASSRGFGYASPNEAGMETQIGGQEAGAMAGAPKAALDSTISHEMAAEQLRAQEAQGLEGVTTATFGPETDLTKQRSANKNQLYSSLSSLAGDALSAWNPMSMMSSGAPPMSGSAGGW